MIRPFGIVIGVPTGIKPVAVPTSFLVDEHGVVRWIDRARDYRVRSDAGRICTALDEVFGGASNR